MNDSNLMHKKLIALFLALGILLPATGFADDEKQPEPQRQEDVAFEGDEFDDKMRDPEYAQNQLFSLLRVMDGKLSDPEDNHLVHDILENPQLLDDQEVTNHFFSLLEKLDDAAPAQQEMPQVKTREVSVESKAHLFPKVLYTLYRKFMFVHTLNNGGQAPGWHWWVNKAVISVYYMHSAGSSWTEMQEQMKAMGLTFGKVLEVIKGDRAPENGEDEKIFMLSLMVLGQVTKVIQQVLSARRLDDDDITEYLNIYTHLRVNRDIAEMYISEPERFEKLKKDHKEWKKFYEGRKKIVKAEVARDGFPSLKGLDFFALFDNELNFELERALDTMLKKMKVSEGIRTFLLKNNLSRLARIALIFKIMPSLIYYHINKMINSDPTALSQFKPYCQALKSAGYLANSYATDRIVNLLNHKKQSSDEGWLDTTKKNTMGVLGPNLIKAFADSVYPYGMIAAGDQWGGGMYRDTNFYLPAGEQFSTHLKKNLVHHVTKSMVVFLILLIIRHSKDQAVGWLANVGSKTLDFMARKNWISFELAQNIRSICSDEQMRSQVLTLGGEFIQMLIEASRKEYRRELLTIHDLREIAREQAKNPLAYFERLIAHSVGNKAGDRMCDAVYGT